MKTAVRSLGFGLLLAALLHADWHLARPLHHRLSFGLQYHWAYTAVAFAIVGWWVARRWPERRWEIGAASLAIGVVIAQLVEPLLEAAFYLHRLAYEVEPARWVAFGEALAAAIPAYVLSLSLSSGGRRSDPPAPPPRTNAIDT